MTTTTEAKVFDPCTRCGGEGSVSWGAPLNGVLIDQATGRKRVIPKVCFQCNGTGGKWVTQATLDRRAKDRERRARKRAEDDARKASEAEEKIAALIDDHPLLAWLTYPQYWERKEIPDFVADIAHKMWKYDLTAKQIAAVERAIEQQTEHDDRRVRRDAEKADKIAAGVAAPTGRTEIVGTVNKIVYRDTEWGTTWKMVVQHDDGWAVWVTVPGDLYRWAYAQLDADTRYAPKTDDWSGWAEFLHGRTVRFTATLKQADDDPLLAFGSRPTKAAVV